ncbi:MAG TPA: glycoside hydrolase family 76 protein, partial [Verrucomicrobiae bacterium]
GGIWEEQPANTSTAPVKAPLSNDSLAQAACLIYQGTTNADYLVKAQQIYSWVRTNLFNPATGLMAASVSTNGVLDTSPALYNQGTFLDLANSLHHLTGLAQYDADALAAVEYTRNHLTVNGVFSVNALWMNTWAAEFARGLGHWVKDHDLWSVYYPWMQANANAAWAARRSDLNLTWNDWVAGTPTTNTLLTSWCVSAVAMLQATPERQPGLIVCTNLLSGAVIGTAGSFGNSGNTAAMVFDGNLTTYFDAPVAAGAWVGLDFGAGISNQIGQISYWPRAGYASRMLGGNFQGANNPAFNNPVTLYPIPTTPPESGVVSSLNITNTGWFRYVRYVSPANGWGNVAEIRFYAPNPPPPPLQITSYWDGMTLQLSWPAGCWLLEANDLSGVWLTNSTAVSPLKVDLKQPSKYYRLQMP